MYRYRNLNIVYRVINIPTMLFFTVFVCVKSLWRFFSTKPCGNNLTEVKKAQNESLRAADKSCTFVANHLHRFTGCI